MQQQPASNGVGANGASTANDDDDDIDLDDI